MIEIHWVCNRCKNKGVVPVNGTSAVDKARGLAQVVVAHREEAGLLCDGSIGSIDISVKTRPREVVGNG